MAKKLITSHTFSVKFRVFRREVLRNHSVYWAQIFRDNWNCYALSTFRVFILLASSGSDKHIFNEAKSVNKDSSIPLQKQYQMTRYCCMHGYTFDTKKKLQWIYKIIKCLRWILPGQKECWKNYFFKKSFCHCSFARNYIFIPLQADYLNVILQKNYKFRLKISSLFVDRSKGWNLTKTDFKFHHESRSN